MEPPVDKKNNQIRSHHSRPRVLVVDAEPEVAGALLEILVYEGFEVELAENRRRAICLLGTRRPFDLMITDMKMLNGLELLSQTRLPPIVLTTCRTAKNGIQFAGKASCDPVLKAYKIERLMSAIVGALKGTRIPLRPP